MPTQTSGTPQSLITQEITLRPSSNPPPTRSSTETHTHAYHQIKINNQPHQTSQQYHPTYSTKHNGKPRQHSTQTIYPSSQQSPSQKTFDSNKHPKPLPTTRKQTGLVSRKSLNKLSQTNQLQTMYTPQTNF